MDTEGDLTSEGGESEGENEEGEKRQMPLVMPYEIWDHITQDEWEAFVAKKTTEKEVVMCQ